MKKLVYSTTVLLAFGLTASASQVTTTCTPNPAPYLGQSNSDTVSCSGFAVPGGNTINWIKLDYAFDINIANFTAGDSTTSFSIDAPGGGLDVNDVANELTRPVSGSRTIFSGFAPFLSDFTLNHSYLGASSRVTGGTFEETFTIDYSPSQVPEPATYGLMGAGLVGLYFARRRS